jgi:hypothetical protein
LREIPEKRVAFPEHRATFVETHQNIALPSTTPMSHHSTLRSLCVSRIAPAVVALALTFTATQAQATVADGQAAIAAKLALIPGASTDILKAKSADLLYAIALAVEDPAVTVSDADIAAGAISTTSSGKARADKDKIAGQIVSTVILSGNLTDNGAGAAAVVDAVFGANSVLKSTGQAAVVAAAVQALTPSAAEAVGQALSTPAIADLPTLLVNTSKVLGKNTPAAATQLASLVDGILPAAGAAAVSAVEAAALKVAASNPAAAGAFYGGLEGSQFNAQTTASAVVTNSKLAKAIGEILANIADDVNDRAALTQTLIGQNAKAAPLIVQGILRSLALRMAKLARNSPR